MLIPLLANGDRGACAFSKKIVKSENRHADAKAIVHPVRVAETRHNIEGQIWRARFRVADRRRSMAIDNARKCYCMIW